MKKFLVHLSVICLLAALMVPMVGCKKEEPVDETATSDMGATTAPATDMAPPSTEMAPPASTDVAPTGTDVAPVTT